MYTRIKICSIILCIIFSTVIQATESTWKNESCLFYDVHIDKSPKGLVEEFLYRDGEGEFLKQNPWLNVVFECPRDLNEPAHFEVIRSYKIVQTKINHDKAAVTVQYEILGSLNSVGEHGELGDFKEDQLTAKMTFELKKTIYGWRIKRNSIIPRVLLKNILRNFPQEKWIPGAEENFKTYLKKLN